MGTVQLNICSKFISVRFRDFIRKQLRYNHHKYKNALVNKEDYIFLKKTGLKFTKEFLKSVVYLK